MSKLSSKALGSQSIGSLLIKQALPASVGILVMSLNILVDTIFVGNWIGTTAIAAINIVLPVSFFIAALGMAIGVGGSSVLSRALGAGNSEKALKTFGNQITLTLSLTVFLVVFGLIFQSQIIPPQTAPLLEMDLPPSPGDAFTRGDVSATAEMYLRSERSTAQRGLLRPRRNSFRWWRQLGAPETSAAFRRRLRRSAFLKVEVPLFTDGIRETMI